MHRRQLLGAILGVLGASCGRGADPVVPAPRATPRVRNRSEARARLAALSERYQELMRAHGEYEWSRYAGKLAEGPSTKQNMTALRAAERDVFVEASGILKRFGDAIVSPRHAALWQRGALGLQLLGDAKASELADELEAVVNGHRFELDGRVVTSSEMVEMRRSDDPRVRRRTRELEHQLHVKAAPIATALLARRRDLARELGKPSFWSALLEVRGAKPANVDRILGELERGTQSVFYKSFGSGGRPHTFVRRLILPWDLDHAVKELAPVPEEAFPADKALDAAYRLYREFGADLQKLDVTKRDFAFGGQTIAVHVPDDVRLVVRPLPGLKFYGLVLHELGHAFATTRTASPDPLFKGYEWVPGLEDPAYAEGVAETFSRLLDVPEVLSRIFGLSAEDAARVVRRRKLEALVGIRRILTSVNFERAALERPEANLDQLSLDVERRFSGTVMPRDVEPTWAGTAFLATYPVYVQSYLLAMAMAVQVRDALRARFGPDFVSKQAGAFLTDRLVGDGARWTLDEKLTRTTGSTLDSTSLLRYLIAS